MRIPAEVAAAADPLARALLGHPDQEGAGELRWGTKGSLSMTMPGTRPDSGMTTRPASAATCFS